MSNVAVKTVDDQSLSLGLSSMACRVTSVGLLQWVHRTGSYLEWLGSER